MRLVKAFPRKMASRLTGEMSRPSSPPCSWSLTKARFIARMAEKANALHRMPGASCSALPGALFRAKLKTTTTSRPKTNTETTRSLERNSSRMSFQTITSTGLSSPFIIRSSAFH